MRDASVANEFAAGDGRRTARSFGCDGAGPGISATRASGIILTCTTSRTPFLGVRHVVAGTFVAAVGADNEQKSEIEPALMRAAAVVADHRGQCETIGDLHHAIAAGAMRASDIRGELGDVVAGTVRGHLNDDEIIIFDSTGVQALPGCRRRGGCLRARRARGNWPGRAVRRVSLPSSRT